jgi:hypothetical protein
MDSAAFFFSPNPRACPRVTGCFRHSPGDGPLGDRSLPKTVARLGHGAIPLHGGGNQIPGRLSVLSDSSA